ncbi:MAG: hypothetical protein E7F47_02030 [Peptoniphilus harei]|nr:hypothetical protein [Peptoniphilus harei]
MKLKLNSYNVQLTIRRVVGIMAALFIGLMILMFISMVFSTAIKAGCCFLYGITKVLDKFFNFFIGLF